MNNSDFDKEEFLRAIHTIPDWVKNGDDLLKFCKHIQYRLLQEKAITAWFEKNVKLEEDQSAEVWKIYGAFDEAYENDVSTFQPFKEIFG